MAELKKTLGYPTIIALTLMAMVGTGMFFGPGLAATYSGVASLISWAILALITIYVATVFGELTSMFPSAGGVYEFAKQAYGRFFSFMIGWLTWLVGNITTTVLIAAAVNAMLPTAGILKVVVALALIVLLNYVAYRGIEASSTIMIVFGILTLTALFAIIVPGVFNLDPVNFTPFFKDNNYIFIFVSLFFIMETFFGWESATFLAEETKNAERVIPRSLLISSILAAFIGIGVAVVSLGIIPWHQLANLAAQGTSSLNTLAFVLLGENGPTFINIGIILTLIGSAAGGIVSAPRLLLALARDKLFIEQFDDISPKTKTPAKAILFQSIVSALVLFIGFGNYQTLLSMLVPLALLMYISILVAVVILRFKMPNRARYFKAPFGKVLPIIISLGYLAIIGVWVQQVAGAWDILKLAGTFVLFGIPIYLLLTFYYNPSAIIAITDFFSFLNLGLERILLPKHIRRKILTVFENIRGKKVLEFGCGVGTMTMQLAEGVGEGGAVIATELSRKNADIVMKRVMKKGHQHVTVIHDQHQVNRVHPDVQEVDMIFSVGMLGYIQDKRKVLKEMSDILPENGGICFVEYIDFFKILPNPKWLSNHEEILRLFHEAGFSVQIKKVKSFFWNYIFIYGIKTSIDAPFI